MTIINIIAGSGPLIWHPDENEPDAKIVQKWRGK